MRNIDPQVTQLLEYRKGATFAEKSLDGVIQPVAGQTFPIGDGLGGSPQVGRWYKHRVDILGRRPCPKYQTHHRATSKIGLAADLPAGKFVVERHNNSRIRSVVSIRRGRQCSNR